MTPSTITRKRRALGLSKVELARQLGVNPSTVWRWETGKARPIRSTEQALLRMKPPKE